MLIVTEFYAENSLKYIANHKNYHSQNCLISLPVVPEREWAVKSKFNLIFVNNTQLYAHCLVDSFYRATLC